MILRRSSTSSEQGQYDDDDVSGQFSRDGERREDGDLGGGMGVLLRLKAGDVIYLIQLTLVPFIVN